jgi:hypothetical protein
MNILWKSLTILYHGLVRIIILKIFKDDNVPYEWRHGKGLQPFTQEELETDFYGYYDKRLLNYYPKALEWQFRDEYPVDDALLFAPQFSPNGWENINENDRNHNLSTQNQTRTPEQFRKEVEEIRSRYTSKSVDPIDSWNNEQPKH